MTVVLFGGCYLFDHHRTVRHLKNQFTVTTANTRKPQPAILFSYLLNSVIPYADDFLRKRMGFGIDFSVSVFHIAMNLS
jgi:hypothetical protein